MDFLPGGEMFKQLWDPEAVQDHILRRHGVEPLNSYYYATTYPAVYAAAERLFGSWGKAITACGLDYARIRKYRCWSERKVLQGIQELAENSEPLHSQYVQQNHKPLYLAALKRFRSWERAIQAAGGRYELIRRRRRWTPERVKAAILELYRQNVDLAYPNMYRRYRFLLAAGMKKLSNGSWVEARRACGIYDNYRRPPARRGLPSDHGEPQP